MTKFTNYTKGPKGLNTEAGLVYVEAGQTVDVEISEAEEKSAKRTGWFSKAPLDHDGDGNDGGSVDELDQKTVPQLKELAETETIDLGGATKRDDILAAIRDHRAKAAAEGAGA